MADSKLPAGWTLDRADEAHSKQYGPDVIRTVEGHFEASKRLNGSTLVVKSATSMDALVDDIKAWEAAQPADEAPAPAPDAAA